MTPCMTRVARAARGQVLSMNMIVDRALQYALFTFSPYGFTLLYFVVFMIPTLSTLRLKTWQVSDHVSAVHAAVSDSVSLSSVPCAHRVAYVGVRPRALT